MGFIASMAGDFLSLIGEKQEFDANQLEMRQNATLAERAAADAMQRGYQEAGRARMAGSQLVAEQKVAAAASGVDPTVGTPAQVSAGTAAIAEIDARTLENNAAREAWGFTTKAKRLRAKVKSEEEALPLRMAGRVLTSQGRVISSASSSYGGRGGGGAKSTQQIGDEAWDAG